MRPQVSMRTLVSAATAGAATLATLTLLAAPASATVLLQDDTESVAAGDFGQFDVTANDSGTAGVTLGVTTQPGAGGNAYFNDQTLIYVAPRDYSGPDTLVYGVVDETGASVGPTATVSVTVSSVGGYTAADDTVHAYVGQSVDVDLGANDTNPTGSDSYSKDNVPLASAFGDLYIGAGGRGQLTGTSPGTEDIAYDVSDGVTGAVIGHATLTVTVQARNVTVVNDSRTTPADEEVHIDVLGNDSGTGIAGDTVDVTQPTLGDYAYFDLDTNEVLYSSSSVGNDTFTYTIHGQNGDPLGTGTVHVTVTPALVVSARADAYDAEKDTTNLLPVFDNDHSNNPVTMTVVSGPTHGTATVVPDSYSAQISYTPDTGWTGPDSLVYQIDDHQGHTSQATVTLHVKQVGVQNLNAAVAWHGAHLTWANPHATTFAGVVVRYNVGATTSDYPAPPASVTDGTDVPVASGATGVDLAGLVNGDNYAFSVFANYGGGVYSEPSTASVTPGIEPLANLHADGRTGSVQLSWTNPQGVESVTMEYSTDGFVTTHPVVVPSGAATVTVSGLTNGHSYDFQAVAHAAGQDSDYAYVTSTPRSTNALPHAVADEVSLNGSHSVDFFPTTNDTDANGDDLEVVANTQPANGTVTCLAFAQCTYTPQSGSVPAESDTFGYTVSDGHGGRSSAVVTLSRRHFTAVADAVDATSVAYSQFDVLANDTGDRLTDRLVLDTTGFTLGTIDVTIGGDDRQLVEFEPNGAAGTQVVHYTLLDENDNPLGGADLTVDVSEAPQVTVSADHPLSSVNAAVTFTGRTTPARAGASILLERYSLGSWHVVQTSTIADASTTTDVALGSPYSFTVRERVSGYFDYRVDVPADSGRAESFAYSQPLGMYAGTLGTVVKTANEYVVVKNSGKVGLNLKSWTITTKAGKKLTLPSKALLPGKSVKVHPGTGRTTSTDLYLKRGASFGNTHDTLTMRDIRKVVVATKRY